MRAVILFWMLMVMSCLDLLAASVSGTRNLVPISDTFLRDQLASATNFGNVTPLLVGIAKEPYFIQNRALLKFDFSEIPTNATITAATLTLIVTRSNTDPSSFDVNRMLVDWAEHEATWVYRKEGVPWSSEGCEPDIDYVWTPSVTAEIDTGVFSSDGLIADVQMWVADAELNHGWIIIATGDQVATGKMIGSRESEFSPMLSIEYSVPSSAPPPVPPLLFGIDVSGDVCTFSFHAEAGRAYAVDFCDSLSSGDWNLLTNISAQPVDRVLTITNVISSPQGFFRAHTTVSGN